MVNVIMPAYNAHNTIRKSIKSLSVQEMQENIKLTIIDDASDQTYDYLLKEFNDININIIRKKFNSGCGQARQCGIDNTDCDYFMFLDADDLLYSVDSVKNLFNTITTGNYDVVSSIFFHEKDDRYIIHKNDFLWMHGKIYRTGYVKNRNIKFNETRANEDNAYNMILLHTKANIHYTEYATYVWKDNKLSSTRKEDYLGLYMNDFIINAEYAVNEVIRINGYNNNLYECIINYFISMYGYYLIFLHQNRDSNFINEYISNVKRYYNNIPIDLFKEDHMNTLLNLFYKNFIINDIINNSVILTPTIYEFIDILK